MTTRPTISLAQARRTALAAQGFADRRPPPGAATMRHLSRVVDRVQVVQIDSVNVLTRSQYLPFFSRLGPYDPALLDGARDGTSSRGRTARRLVEYWAHEASLVPPATWPLLTFRMEAARERGWSGSVSTSHPGLLEAVSDVIVEHGPLTSREVEAHLPHGADRGSADWGWNWSAVKNCLEYLFWVGDITSAGRSSSFERRYAAPAAVLPAEVVAARDAARDADPQEAVTELIRLSLVAHGLGSQRCLADYFRVRGPRVEVGLQELERRGLAERVRVRGWDRPPLWRDPAARAPRRVPGAALLSPFDSLIWQRERTEALWGMRYRLEIYVPAPQRVFGYYVLPFLLDEQLVGRVDLKADRASGSLLVRSLHWEEGVDRVAGHAALTGELEAMASWLGLDRVDFAKP
ncbi:winged helix-turn-helix domain-containing protein [Ornithinimicrobium cerasi]|uniref:winged helix-turn-helix domain-containing protein n=1 Tax=Ornithinimicrobium cerasi TaxID=2248773 RepID=UPI000F00DEDE|nr:crosslink repair DNA glycosylase YcaQ family protein [Ornithinimicrobium cerasi]